MYQEVVMVVFLLALVAVFIVVDLLVRFVFEPMVDPSKKRIKAPKLATNRFDPRVKLATETMFDGGKPHKDTDLVKESESKSTEENETKE